MFQRQVEQPDDAPQYPAADEIDRQREEDFQQYPDRLGEEVLQYGLEIEVRNFMDGLREMGFLHTVGQHQRRGRLGS